MNISFSVSPVSHGHCAEAAAGNVHTQCDRSSTQFQPSPESNQTAPTMHTVNRAALGQALVGLQAANTCPSKTFATPDSVFSSYRFTIGTTFMWLVGVADATPHTAVNPEVLFFQCMIHDGELFFFS